MQLLLGLLAAFLFRPVACLPPEEPWGPAGRTQLRFNAMGSKKPLDAWIEGQKLVALESVKLNIGPNPGSKGALPGVVIASPSTDSPNYLFTWTRDAALVMKGLLETLITTGDASLEVILRNYVEAQGVLQQLPNPSGTFTTGGLGEPKFNIDLTAFTDSWGRPQRDGPALRATTLIGLANFVLDAKTPDTTFVTEILAPMIKADLDFIATYWNYTGFDLWEEVSGSSFFTTAVQHRALVEGVTFFDRIGAPESAYTIKAIDVLCFLQNYWAPSGGFVVSNINLNNAKDRSGVDAASVLASIHTFDSLARTCDPTTFQPCSDRALANLKVFVDSFREIYPLNDGIAPTGPVAVGRYPEDVYYSGNPWYLTTLAVAEQLYDALWVWQKAGQLNVTVTSLFFFQDVFPAAIVGNYTQKTREYHLILNAVWAWADGFVEIVKDFTPPGGMLWEQFDKIEGTPASASNLTWSYGSFLTATAARKGTMPPGWNSGLSASLCAPGAPSQFVVRVTFHEIVETVYGESVWIVGSTPELGNWDPASALVLSAAEYSAGHHVWVTELLVPASSVIEYKFVRKGIDGAVTWETGPNRVLVTNAAGSHQFISGLWQ